MFFPWQVHYLVFQHFESFDKLGTGFCRLNNLINKTTLGCTVWVSEDICILLFHLFPLSFGVWSTADLTFKNDLGRTFSTHYRYLSTWPGKVHIRANMFGVHYIVS